jgi:hypothetical protein
VEVLISKKTSSHIIAGYEIELGSINSKVTENDYFEQAWENAVEDGLVDEGTREDYRFELR